MTTQLDRSDGVWAATHLSKLTAAQLVGTVRVIVHPSACHLQFGRLMMLPHLGVTATGVAE